MTETATTEETAAPPAADPAEQVQEQKQLAIKLARYFVDRATAQQFSGRVKDFAAMEFWLGAAQMAILLGRTDVADRLCIIAALLISARGYEEVKTLAEMPLPFPID